MTASTLLIRTDASPALGAGHVMRCVALAQEWAARGGRVVFATCQLVGLAEERIRGAGFARVNVDAGGSATRRAASDAGASWVVLDVGTAVHGHLAELQDVRTLVIDDLGGTFDRVPTLVLNQNPQGPASTYAGVPRHSLLLGLQYLMLRNEFVAVQPQPEIRPVCRNVLVALGATDPTGLLPSLASALLTTVPATVHVVASQQHARLQELLRLGDEHGRLRLHLDVVNMAALMADLDLAVTSGGTTVWELAYLGVPALVGAVSEVEQRMIEALVPLDLYGVLGYLPTLEPAVIAERVVAASEDLSWRTAMSQAARKAVDGHGRRRVVDAMLAKERDLT